MKIEDIGLLLTDTHLAEDTIDLNKSIFRQAIKVCQDRGLSRIFHLGDVFDSRKSQSLQVLNAFHEICKEIDDARLTMYVIPGNHDKTSYTSKESFLDVFKYHPCLYLFEEGGVIQPLQNKQFFVYMLPFFSEHSTLYQECLSNILTGWEEDSICVLLTHIGVTGAKMNSGDEVEGINQSVLTDYFDQVYIGHYHDYQELADGVITYIGSAYQHNFGENNLKGFQILKSDGSIEFIRSKFPEYRKIVINIDEIKKNHLDELKSDNTNSTDKVRFIFKGSGEKLAKIDKHEYASLGIDVKTEEFSVEVQDYSTQQVVTFSEQAKIDEWKDFTKDDQEKQELGLEYLSK